MISFGYTKELFDNLTEWTGEDINVDTVGLLKDTLFVEVMNDAKRGFKLS